MSYVYAAGAHTALTRLGLSKLAAIPPEVLARAAQEGAAGAFSEAAPVWNAMRGFKGTPEQGRAHLLQQLDALTSAARQGPAGGAVPPQLFTTSTPNALGRTAPAAALEHTAPGGALPRSYAEAPPASFSGGLRKSRPFSWHE